MKSFLFGIGIFLLLPTVAFAQSTPQLSVFPSVIQLDLAKDKPETTLTYKNFTDQPIELTFQAQDFKELEDGYKLSYLAPKDINNYQYRLSSWIQFSDKSLIVNSHSSANLAILILKDKLSPGGHYASILAEMSAPLIQGNKIQVKGILGSLLFVRTNTGTEKEEGSLPTFEIVRDFFDFPKTTYFRFNNTGDVDLVPHGLVQILDRSGNLVAKGIVNETSAPALPESIRRYYVPIRNIEQFLLPDMYTAKLYIHYGKSDQKLYKTISFFSQGSIMLIPITIIILLGLITYWYKRRRRSSKNLE